MSEARINGKIRKGARCSGVLSIQRLSLEKAGLAADANPMQFECSRAAVLRAERATPQSRKGSADRAEVYGSARLTRTESMAR